MDNIKKYEQLKTTGASPEEVYRIAEADGLNSIQRIKLVKQLYSLGLKEAKQVSIVASGVASSLDEHQSNLADALQEALDRGDFDDLKE